MVEAFMIYGQDELGFVVPWTLKINEKFTLPGS